jgi:lipoprotein-anchoring transpeptidase ErfK/SrfK
MLKIDIAKQQIDLIKEGKLIRSYPASTASKGPGERMDSGCTPRGRHRVRLKIGSGCPENTVFVARRPTGEIYSPELAVAYPRRDWVLSRIIWLTGAEPGINRGGRVDSLRRFIYIHGCPDSEPMGIPRSHGCIRMRNHQLIELFEQIENGEAVEILPAP